MKDKLSELGYLVFLTDSGQRAHGRIATLEKIFAALAAKMNKKFHENDVSPLISRSIKVFRTLLWSWILPS